MPENELTVEYFFKEYHSFRKEMCSKQNTIQQKLDMFKGLVYVYVNVKQQNPQIEQRLQMAMKVLKTELDMRLGKEALQEIHNIYSKYNEN